MQKEFELEVIFTITTGISFVDDITKVYKLAQFIYNDPLINDNGLLWLKKDIKEHIFNIHPELINLNFIPSKEILLDDWLKKQKIIFGETLPISRYGLPLEESVHKKIKA